MTACKDLNPLVALHELGLLPLVKKVQFPSGKYRRPWMVPEIFTSGKLPHFSTLTSVQDLVIADMGFSEFTSGTEDYFGHFSPTLRSIALLDPRGTHRQLLDLLRLFPNLDNIKIVRYDSGLEAHDTVDTQRAQIRGSLRGKLELDKVWDQKLLEEIIASFGGMGFVFMDLTAVEGVQLILDACAETLQTLRFRPESLLHSCKRFLGKKGTTSELTEHVPDSLSIGPEPQPLAQHGPSIVGGSSFQQLVGIQSRSQGVPSHHHLLGFLRDRCYIFRGGSPLATTMGLG